MNAVNHEPPGHRLVTVVLTFAIAGVGGLVFSTIGVPAAWLSGPAAAVAIAVMAGFKAHISSWIRSLSLLFLGATMGASVTPDTIGQLAHTPLTVAGLLVCLIAVMGSVTLYLRWVHGFNWLDAQLAAAPGASLYVLALAQETGADVRRVSVIQIIRVVALIILLPSIFALMGFAGDVSASPVAMRPVDWHEVAILAAAAITFGYLFEYLKVPTGTMFGAMLAGGVLFGTGVVATGLPEWMMLPGFLVIGAIVGSTFQGTTRAQFMQSLVAAGGTILIGSAASLAVAVPMSYVAALPLAQMWLAYAPGGVDAMAVLALAIGLEPAFVAAHHLTRFIALAMFLPFWFRGHIRRHHESSRSTP